MSNTNIDYLYPEFWAMAFDEADLGMYNLQNYISRKYEDQLARFGDRVNVPLVPDMSDASSWTPGDSITGDAVTQEVADVTLDRSYRKTITLTGKELSLSAYDLIVNYGVPMAEKILEAVNDQIYLEALSSTYFVNNPATAIDEDKIVDLKVALDNNKVGKANRVLLLAPDDVGTLLKKDAFQYANYSGDGGKAIVEGELIRKFGFQIVETNAIEKYTPADLVGAINNGAGYVAGTETVAVDAFNDDANLIRVGDMWKLAANATWYTVTAATLTGGDTTGISLSQSLVGNSIAGLADAAANDDAVTFTACRSGLALVPSAMAFAARPYAMLPAGAGVSSFIANYGGLPIRVSVWHDGKLGLNVQYDVLFGVTLVKAKRLVRLIAA